MTAAKTRAELFDKIRALINHGWYDLPSQYGGTGGPGRYLEDLLGLTLARGTSPTPNSGGN